jgi:alkylation response protein AidB-like acyl-CoA dehydrogenase
MNDSTRLQSAALARTLAEMADGSLAARIRLEQAARVIAAARRASDLAAAGALRLPNMTGAAVQAVTEIARHWDSDAVTALEYAETLPEAALERLLRAAPFWAATFGTVAPDRLAA